MSTDVAPVDATQMSTEILPAKKVIAAIPCLNEERNIGSVVLAALRWVDEVIVIDDGSIDDTSLYRQGRRCDRRSS